MKSYTLMSTNQFTQHQQQIQCIIFFPVENVFFFLILIRSPYNMHENSNAH